MCVRACVAGKGWSIGQLSSEYRQYKQVFHRRTRTIMQQLAAGAEAFRLEASVEGGSGVMGDCHEVLLEEEEEEEDGLMTSGDGLNPGSPQQRKQQQQRQAVAGSSTQQQQQQAAAGGSIQQQQQWRQQWRPVGRPPVAKVRKAALVVHAQASCLQ